MEKVQTSQQRASSFSTQNKTIILFNILAISHAPTRFWPGISDYMSEPARLKRVGPGLKNEPARQVSQPATSIPALLRCQFSTRLI